MPPLSPPTPPSQGILFVSYTFPSLTATGPQIRAAAIVRMLAARGVVHVMVVNLGIDMPDRVDACTELGAAATTYVRVALKTEPDRDAAHGGVPLPNSKLHRSICEAGALAALLTDYAKKHELEQLFVFRMQTLAFVQGCLDAFSIRMLDLDELPSRHHRVIGALRNEADGALEKRARMTALVLEKKLVPRFTHVFASSRPEAEEVRQVTGCKTYVLPNIRPVSTTPAPLPGLPPGEFLFVGALHYLPNSDGVIWFCREVLPLLRDRLGEAAWFRVIGFGKAPDLDAIRDLPGVCLSGYQADLAPFYAQASVVVVPLRAGTGTRLKILEAFAYGRPVVSTTIGAEGIEANHGEHLLLADSAPAFADACMAVIREPALAARLVDAAGRFCHERFSGEALGRNYDAAVQPDGTLPVD